MTDYMNHVPAPDRYENKSLFKRCGKSGLKLPRLSLGLWHNFGDETLLENARSMIFRAFDLGITHFDLANNYGPPPGSAESNFGRILRESLSAYRDEMIISTKAGYYMWHGPYGEWGSRKYLISSLDQSLKRMGLDYVDIFYSHRFDPDTPLEETMGALDTAVRSGKALYVGVSNYPLIKPGRQRASCKHSELLVSSINHATICLIDGWKRNCWTCLKLMASAASHLPACSGIADQPLPCRHSR